MKEVFVCFNDLDPNDLAKMLARGDVWHKESQVSALAHSELSGLLPSLLGEVSVFSETSTLTSVLQDVFLHYAPTAPVGPFSGPWDVIVVIGYPLDAVAKALAKEDGLVLGRAGANVVVTRSTR